MSGQQLAESLYITDSEQSLFDSDMVYFF